MKSTISKNIRDYSINTSDRTDERAEKIVNFLECIGEIVYPTATFKSGKYCDYFFYHDGFDWCGASVDTKTHTISCQDFISRFIPEPTSKPKIKLIC